MRSHPPQSSSVHQDGSTEIHVLYGPVACHGVPTGYRLGVAIHQRLRIPSRSSKQQQQQQQQQCRRQAPPRSRAWGLSSTDEGFLEEGAAASAGWPLGGADAVSGQL